MSELIKPASELQRVESGMEDILRWADDGGKMLDSGNRTNSSDTDHAWKRSSQRGASQERFNNDGS
jgi:hypothetical protein